MMQWDGKAPKIHIKLCTKCLLYAWDKKKIITSVMNHFFLINLLYEWNVELAQTNED